MILSRIEHLVRSRSGRILLAGGSAALAFALVALVARHVAEARWSLPRGNPGLLVGAGALSLLGYGFKAYGWRQLFAPHERPQPLALLAANGGASITALALPGRFDDIVRVAIVRRFRGCPAGVRTICLSLALLGLIDAAALAPFALAAALLPGHSPEVRLGLALITSIGLAAGAFVLLLPRATGSKRVLRFRIGRWLTPRTTSSRGAVLAWALVSAYWVTRAMGLVLVLGALGIGFSFTLALLFICATSAASALPVGPGAIATQAGAGAAVLIASGVGVSNAVGAALMVQAVGMIVGGSILVFATAWRTGCRRHAIWSAAESRIQESNALAMWEDEGGPVSLWEARAV